MDKPRLSETKLLINNVINIDDNDDDDDDDDGDDYDVINNIKGNTSVSLKKSVNINISNCNNKINSNDNNDISSNNPNLNTNKWLRLHKLLSENWYLNYVLPCIIFIMILIIMYLCRNYAKKFLIWIENQNPWLIFSLFIFMFICVSFPITIGYLILMITSGYLFGYIKGLLIVILGANLGVLIAHNTIKHIHGKLPIYRLIKSDTGRAILRVISGPRAFKVVMFTRLTPIPFGLQNTIFGISSVNSRTYHTATLIGLLPAQAINVYLGSTLRSMHDVLNNHHTALNGYVIFSIQMLIAVFLMLWVIQKAKTELSQALLSDIDSEHKIVIDIDT